MPAFFEFLIHSYILIVLAKFPIFIGEHFHGPNPDDTCPSFQGFCVIFRAKLNLMVPRREVESAVFPAVFDCVTRPVDLRLFRSWRCPEGGDFHPGEPVLKLQCSSARRSVAMEHPPLIFVDDFPIRTCHFSLGISRPTSFGKWVSGIHFFGGVPSFDQHLRSWNMLELWKSFIFFLRN